MISQGYKSRPTGYRGFLLAECLLAIASLALVVGALWQTGITYRRAREAQQLAETARSACENALEKIRCGIDWRDVIEQAIAQGAVLTVDSEQGDGAWEGLELVTVSARCAGLAGQESVRTLRGYVSEKGP